MADTSLILSNNLSHNVSVRLEAAKSSLNHLATLYLVTEVAGQSQATVDAQRRDLQRFLTFYQDLYKAFREKRRKYGTCAIFSFIAHIGICNTNG